MSVSPQTDKIGHAPPPNRLARFNTYDPPSPKGTEHDLTQDASLALAHLDDPAHHDPLKQAARARETFRRAHAEQSLTLNDLLPHRIRVAWRIVREIARLTGKCRDESLVTALSPHPGNPDPWTVPEETALPANREVSRHIWPECVSTLLEAELLENPWRVKRMHTQTGEWHEYPGLPLLPPPIPVDLRDDPDYDPTQDKLLLAWLALVKQITARLMLARGSKEHPELGTYGLEGMLDPSTVRAVFPSRFQIMSWESIVIDTTLEMLIKTNQRGVRLRHFEKHGMLDHESAAMCKLALSLAREQTVGSVEDARAIMVLRLEDYTHRAREGLDLRNELAAMKQLSLVQGLTAEREDDTFRSMLEVVREVGKERRLAQTPALDTPPRQFVENTAGGD